MHIYNVADCFSTAHLIAFRPTNIQSGFRIVGLWPFIKHIFVEDEFQLPLPSTATLNEQPTSNDLLDNIEILGPSTSDVNELRQKLFKSLDIIRPFPKALPRKHKKSRSGKSKSRVLIETPRQTGIRVVGHEKRNLNSNKKAVKKWVL